MGYKEKIKAELDGFGKASQKAKAISKEVADALCSFAEQEQEFAQAIEQSGRTLKDCCESIAKGIGNSISDLEVYEKAVKFYFSSATVHFQMNIDLCGGNGYQAPPIEKHETAKQSSISISLDDLLDF